MNDIVGRKFPLKVVKESMKSFRGTPIRDIFQRFQKQLLKLCFA